MRVDGKKWRDAAGKERGKTQQVLESRKEKQKGAGDELRSKAA